MRFTSAGLVILSNVLLFNLCLYAQEKTSSADIESYRGRVPEPLFTKISVDLKEMRFEQALKEIAEKGNFRLNYNRSRIPVEQRVTVRMDSVPALQALFKILGDTETGLKITREGQLAVVPSRKRIAGNVPAGLIRGQQCGTDAEDDLDGLGGVEGADRFHELAQRQLAGRVFPQGNLAK